MKTYKTIATDQDGNKKIIEMEYPSKKAFIADLRANGYKVCDAKVKEASEWDRIIETTNCEKWDWK